ncbi:MAG TPA: hypothetical protein VK927_02545, partial [Adhaeribacter sp.]|nr:hypothetical protein [Adhaeribacter sp.]
MNNWYLGQKLMLGNLGIPQTPQTGYALSDEQGLTVQEQYQAPAPAQTCSTYPCNATTAATEETAYVPRIPSPSPVYTATATKTDPAANGGS